VTVDEPGNRRPGVFDAVGATGFKTAALLARLTPGPLATPMAELVGTGLAQAMRTHRHTVERHQRRVNPELDGRELRRTVYRAFDSYARYWVESLRLPHLSARAVDRGLAIEGYEHFEVAMNAGRGAIMAIPHLGGWEWAGRWVADRGFEITVVVEPLQPPEVFAWFRSLREELGMHVVPLGPDAVAACSRALKQGHVLCLLSDRDIGGGGIEVEFFGERTRLPAGPAMLSLRSGAPILPTAIYYTDRHDGHLGVVRPPVTIERAGRLRDDVTRLTQALAAELEICIRRAPDQWHLFQPNWPSDPGYGL
jgi:phosphatidylinositol dimannoside acyltransferase